MPRSRMIQVRLSALAVSVAFAVSACGSSPPPSAASPEHAAGRSHRPSQHAPKARSARAAARRRGASPTRQRSRLATLLLCQPELAWRCTLCLEARCRQAKCTAFTANLRRLSDPRVESCLSERVSEIRFGDLEKPSTARWTFVFRLVDPPAKSKSGAQRQQEAQSHGR